MCLCSAFSHSANLSPYSYGNCVPYVREERGNPCDPLFRAGIDYVYVPFTRAHGNLTFLNSNVDDLNIVVELIDEPCKEVSRKIVCYFYYPPCGNSTHFEPPQAVCPEACSWAEDTLCTLEWKAARQHVDGIKDFLDDIGLNFINCSNPSKFIDPLPHYCSDAGVNVRKYST